MKVYKWTFQFKEQNVSTIVRDIDEDIRIQEDVGDGVHLVHLPSPGRDAFINMLEVLFVLRDEVDESIQEPEETIPDE